MILRLVAAGSLALGMATLSIYLMELGRAPWSTAEERHLRNMKNRVDPPTSYTPIDFATMAALPRRAPLARVAAIENRGVSLEGYVQVFARAADDDYHLNFVPAIDPGGRLAPFLSVEIAPQQRPGPGGWAFERLAERFRPRYGTRASWESPPRRTRISGWLMYDAPYEGSKPPPGIPPHLTFWEIHPVTRIEVWNDALARYEEVPR